MPNTYRVTRLAPRAFLLMLGMSISSVAWAEPRTLGLASIPYESFFKSVYPIITEVDPGMSVGQTFFATGTGSISEFEFSPGGEWDVSVYEGRGNGGTLLHSQFSKCTSEKCVVKFSQAISVTGDKHYTIVLKNKMDRMLGLYATRGDAYTEGNRIVFKSNYNASECDLYFQVRGDLSGQFTPSVPMEILTAKPEVKDLSLKPDESVAQSFLAPGTGTFERLYLDVSGKFDVEFYAGEGTQGTKLDAQTLQFTNSLSSLTRAIPVEATRQYTLVVTNRNREPQTIGQTQGNGYAHGVKLLKLDPYTIEYDIAFRLTGWTKKIVELPAPPAAPTYDPYRAASGPLTVMNCESSEIQVSTFNANDRVMVVPFKTYRVASGGTSNLECRSPTCRLAVDKIKTEPMTGYHVMVRGGWRTTHPEAMAAGCRLYAKYK